MSESLSLFQQWQSRWNSLASRERNLLLVAAVIVAAAALWWLALAPALTTLRAVDVQHQKLDAQLQQMQSLQAQAKALQTQPKLTGEDAQRTLAALLKQTLPGTAQMSVVGDRVTVTLKGATADSLAQWVTQARINARAIPSEVRLARSGANSAASPANNRTVAWDGTLVLTLPAR